MSVDWDRIRAEFPALENWTYLNTATYGQMPRCGSQAMARHLERRDALACADFLEWFDDMDRVRESVARLVSCAPGDVAFMSNAASALSLLLGGIGWQPGDRVVTLENEFPNNIYYPALLGLEGVEFVEAPWNGFYDAITDRTRLVVLSTVNYTNGFRPPVEEVADFLRSRGVYFYLDGTQSAGALRFDFGRVQPDMFAVHGYKWLLSPTGSTFVCVHERARRWLKPNVIGWRSHQAWRNVDHLHHGAPEFKQAAEKYEGGMICFALLYAMGAAVEMMLGIGVDEIERRVLSLAAECRERLCALGAEVADFDSPIVAARFPGIDASPLARELKARRVLVSARHGNLRVSPHFYNNQQDLDRLESVLRECLGKRE